MNLIKKDMNTENLKSSLLTAKHIVIFTGAGVSADSGIPTFRGQKNGLWGRYDASKLASAQAFEQDPALVWGWYQWRKAQVMKAAPCAAHLAIAQMQDLGPHITLITQNVDDLHERAGSKNVIHLHGSLFRSRCFDCGQPYSDLNDCALDANEAVRIDPPNCPQCNGRIRPGVVWFGEPLSKKLFDLLLAGARRCDVMIVAGTSGLVRPAIEIPKVAARAGAKLVEINPEPSLAQADFSVKEAASVAFPKILKMMQRA